MKLEHERQIDELRTACAFLISQVEVLAHRSFSEGATEWIEKNDAVNCGKRALSNSKPMKIHVEQQSRGATDSG